MGSSAAKKTIKRHLEAYLQKQGGQEQNTEDISTTYYAEASFSAGPTNTFHSMLQSGNPFASTSDVSDSDFASELSNDSDSDSANLGGPSDPSENDSPPPSDVDDYHSDDHEPVEVGNDKITDFVLRTLLSKVNYGWSQEETMAQIRNFYEVLYDEHIPHKN